MHFGDPRLAPTAIIWRRDADKSGQEHQAEDEPDNSEQLRLGEQALDEFVAHKPKAIETRPPSPVQARRESVKRERAMRPDFCAASISSSALSIGAGATFDGSCAASG